MTEIPAYYESSRDDSRCPITNYLTVKLLNEWRSYYRQARGMDIARRGRARPAHSSPARCWTPGNARSAGDWRTAAGGREHDPPGEVLSGFGKNLRRRDPFRIRH